MSLSGFYFLGLFPAFVHLQVISLAKAVPLGLHRWPFFDGTWQTFPHGIWRN